MTEIETARILLGVREGDGEVRIRERYRLLAYAWHPDRFVDNPRLTSAAQAEMAKINEAYALLTGKRRVLATAGRGRTTPTKKRYHCDAHTFEDTLLRCDECGQLVCHLCATATRAGGYLCRNCKP